MLRVSDYFDELRLRRDSQVADFGCGVGENVKILSDLVPDGRVFALDVEKSALEFIDEDKKKGEEEGRYQNISTVWCDFEELDGTRLRDDSIDAILISNTFFLLKHKRTCIMEMKRVLKKYGRILFIDWHTALGKAIMHRQVVLHEDEVMTMFREADMVVNPLVFKDQHHFVLVIEKR
jgi:ubiquinone/menaquinone biosynthesis C-methylase UbiE